jgi:CRP/FNR family transcriptional regulator
LECLCKSLVAKGDTVAATCIGELWVFENIKPEELQEIAKSASRRSFSRGEPIFMQGDPCKEVCFIKTGRVKLNKLFEDGSEVTLDIRKAGDFIGENMLGEETDYPVSAWCIEEALICSFTRERFEEVVLSYPGIGLQVIKNLSNRIAWLTERIEGLSTTKLEDRLHRVLMQVAREHGVRNCNGFTIQFPLSHEELSFLTGSHRVSITRAMRGLKKAGKIVQNGKLITLPF